MNLIKVILIVAVLSGAQYAYAGLEEGNAAYDKGDYATALREIKPLAISGNAKAQNLLGVMYGHGRGVPQDYKESAALYRKAADQGDATAQYNLGLSYKHGEGVSQDYQKAAVWLRKAANKGDAPAQNILGVMYDNGNGVPQDYKQAIAWFRKAANQGNVFAQRNLGTVYEDGTGTPANHVVAYALYNLAAANEPSDSTVSRNNRDNLAKTMSSPEIEEAQALTSALSKQGNFLKALDGYLELKE